MKTYRFTFITNANREYTSELFATKAPTREEAFGEFVQRYGVEGSGVAFPTNEPFNVSSGVLVFVPTDAVSSVEIVEIPSA